MYKQGLILVITGNGKGKTTSAMGMAVRALGHGMKVAVIQFMKGNSNTGEYKLLSQLGENRILFRQVGSIKFVNKYHPQEEDKEKAAEGWEIAQECLRGDFSLVILDEINVAMDFGLIDVSTVAGALQNKHADMTVILTGRDAPPSICQLADTVSIVNEQKHHFNVGIQAQAGIEF